MIIKTNNDYIQILNTEKKFELSSRSLDVQLRRQMFGMKQLIEMEILFNAWSNIQDSYSSKACLIQSWWTVVLLPRSYLPHSDTTHIHHAC